MTLDEITERTAQQMVLEADSGEEECELTAMLPSARQLAREVISALDKAGFAVVPRSTTAQGGAA